MKISSLQLEQSDTDMWNVDRLNCLNIELHFSFVTGSSIFEILPLTFYSIGRKEKDIIGVDKWLQLLKKFDLMDFVKNHSLKMKAPEKEIQNWYYLGPTS